jgi:multicomponent Na+:H+ antiporter subunit G
MKDAVAAVLMVIGGAFMLLAALGVVRMPDVFLRTQATSKASTLGVGCLMLGTAVHFADLGTALRATVIIVLFFVTAPIAAHVIARAAYLVGAGLWRGTVIDELGGRLNVERDDAQGGPGGASRRPRTCR